MALCGKGKRTCDTSMIAQVLVQLMPHCSQPLPICVFCSTATLSECNAFMLQDRTPSGAPNPTCPSAPPQAVELLALLSQRLVYRSNALCSSAWIERLICTSRLTCTNKQARRGRCSHDTHLAPVLRHAAHVSKQKGWDRLWQLMGFTGKLSLQGEQLVDLPRLA